MRRYRIAYGTEISPTYTDIICKRFETYAGVKPAACPPGRHHRTRLLHLSPVGSTLEPVNNPRGGETHAPPPQCR